MVRKRMAWVLLPVLALIFTGCPKKKPEPPPKPIAMESTPVTPPPAPPVEVEEPADVSGDTVEVDPLDSEDLREVNRAAIERGFHPDVHFQLDKSELSEETREKLAANAAFLRQNPQFVVTVEGHCDERGTNEYNLALGNRRANTSTSYMASLGVSDTRMKTISYGEERPVCNEASESCWWRNRRAHMFISARQ